MSNTAPLDTERTKIERFAPGVYYTPTDLAVSRSEIAAFVRRCAKHGVRCIVPRLTPALPPEITASAPTRTLYHRESDQRAKGSDARVLEFFRRVYQILLDEAKKNGIGVAFHAERPLEHMVVRAAPPEAMRAYLLERREYYPPAGEHVSLTLSDAMRQAAVAVDLHDGELIDVEPMIRDGNVLEWDVPTGNWCVHEFLCRHDPLPGADYLSYEASFSMLNNMYALFADLFDESSGAAPTEFHFSDIGFHAPNHRSWTPRFNAVFKERYDCDPRPLYPYLYDAEDGDTVRAKAMLFECRAFLLEEGICRALAHFCAQHGWKLVINSDEPKSSAPSAHAGDPIQNGAIAPGTVMNRTYLYGFNSLKIAAAAAYNAGKTTVNGELFRDYDVLTPKILYQDTINALMRGVNCLYVHPDGCLRADSLWSDEQKTAYVQFVSRASALLREGTHVCDIAMIYPIHSLHASVSFYEAPPKDEEYPDLPGDTDYTTLINSLAFCAGHDVTLLHPSKIPTEVTVENEVLCLHGANGVTEHFRVLILPSARILSPEVMRLVRRFYENGGKIIATGERLPSQAFAPFALAEAADAELAEHLCAVFGEQVLDPTIVAGRLYRKHESGGEAFWFYPGNTAADGTMMVESRVIRRALLQFDLPLDVVIPAMPRFAEIGALGNPYPEFAVLDLNHAIPGGGMLEHLHKRRGGRDLYYFGNSTRTDFEGEVFLRGRFSALTQYDPHTGRYTPLPWTQVLRHGSSYAKIQLHIPAIRSCFVIGEAIFEEK